MKKVNRLFYLALLFIILYTQFFHPVNGLADDQIGLITSERVIQDVTPQDGYKDLMDRYIETGVGLQACSSKGMPWISPIYTLITHSYSSLVGLSIPKWHFLSVLLFVGLLFMAKKVGDLFFGRNGFIFPFLMATNLYILVSVRNSIHLFLLGLLLQLGAIYFFLKSHQKFDLKKYSLTALFLFLALGNGYAYIPVAYIYLLVIFASLVLWRIFSKAESKSFSLWRKEYYLFLFLGIPLLAISSYFVNDMLLNTPLGSSLDSAFYLIKSRFAPSEFSTFGAKIGSSILRYKEIFQGTHFREIYGPHITFFPFQTPVLDKASSFLFFLGILSFFKNFTYKKFILLFFLIYTSYFLYNSLAARIFVVFVPFLLLISSSGFVFFLEILKRLKFNHFTYCLFLSVLFGLLFYNVYFFEDYFVVKSNSNLIKGAGIADVKRYLDSIKKDKVLVFAEADYPVWYLADFRKTDFIINSLTSPEEFRKKILSLESEYDEVIFIFPTNFTYIGNPGLLTDIWEDFNYRYRYFWEAFPEKVTADKVFYDFQGIPQHFIYKFSKDEELPKVKRLTIGSSLEKIPLGFSGEIQAIRISGGVEKLIFEGKGEVLVKSSPSTDVILNFGQESFYNFYLNFGNESYKENLFQSEKAAVDQKFIVQKNGSFAWIQPNGTAQPPFLLEYLFDFPYLIKKVEVKTDMRMFNSQESKTAIKAFLVGKENDFSDYLKKGNRFSFLEIKSDNTNTYGLGGERNVLDDPQWGLGRLSSYAVLKPKETPKVLISLLTESKYYWTPSYFAAHFYNLGQSSFIKFTLDTHDLEKINVDEGTLLSLEKNDGEKKPVAVDVIYN